MNTTNITSAVCIVSTIGLVSVISILRASRIDFVSNILHAALIRCHTHIQGRCIEEQVAQTQSSKPLPREPNTL